MGEVTAAAVISGIVLLAISLTGWASQRATPESRLILKVKKHGEAWTFMPESREKDLFGERITATVKELNQLADQKQQRTLINALTLFTSALGIGAVSFIAPQVVGQHDTLLLTLIGAALGLAIGGLNAIATWSINRRVKRLAAAKAKMLEHDRQERIRRGEAIGLPSTD
jgi:hypothetical protein